MTSETICPFCGAGRPFDEREEVAHADEEIYRCPCGALFRLIGSERLDEVAELLCVHYLEAPRDACHVEQNYVTHTYPPLLVLWAKRGPLRSA